VIRAPFNKKQIKSINAYQTSGVFHELTCGNNHPEDRTLYAMTEGLKCHHCSYTQDWVPDFTTDFSWKPKPRGLKGLIKWEL
jgi:hypothetical protein